jgi:uncharacterized protein
MSGIQGIARRRLSVAVTAALIVGGLPAGGAGALHAAQGGRGRGMGGGMMGEQAHQRDMQLLRALFDNRDRITRQVTVRANGVSTLTESDDPMVAKLIQTHVESMSARVEDGRPIHQRDPLFREIFKHADDIAMIYERTPRGVRVIEISNDPCVVKLIQAHAEVVSAFIANGRAEAMKNHAVPQACK